MSIRVIVQTSLLAASLLFVACPARSTSDAGTGGGSGGGTGGGTGKTDAGVDAGMTVADAGMAPETILAAKRSMFPALVNLKNVVVTAVAFAARSTSTGADCAGSTTKGVNASYWVADSNGDHSGVFVTKYRCDPPFDYLPVIGDVLDMTGYIGLEDEFVGREQRRFIVKQQYDFIKPSPGAAGCVLPRCQPLEVTKKGTMAALPDSMVNGTFGEAGAVRANPTFAGSRVKIVADLTISAANPLALRRASMVPGDDRYYGFQLSNGVLVNNYLTFARFEADGGILADGGTSPCDFRLVALDGGSVTFSSVSGVWDSYTYVGCSDGGTLEKDSRCFPKRYWVPGTDAGTTNVLYPMSCADFQLK